MRVIQFLNTENVGVAFFLAKSFFYLVPHTGFYATPRKSFFLIRCHHFSKTYEICLTSFFS